MSVGSGISNNPQPATPQPVAPSTFTTAATARTLTDSDHGQFLAFSAAGAVTLTVPVGLRPGFFCWVLQAGAGTVTPTSASGVTINQHGAVTGTAAQWAVIRLTNTGVADVYVMSGDMA